MFCSEEGMVDAFLIFLGLRILCLHALKLISPSLSPPIYLGMLRKFLNFLSFKLVPFRDDVVDQRSAKFCLFFCSKGPDSKSLCLHRPDGLCCDYSTCCFSIKSTIAIHQ